MRLHCLGKTTYATKVEAETGAIRFALDEWMLPLFGEHMERAVFDEKLLAQNVSVILDFGFWKKQQRAEITAWAQGLNANLQLVHFNVDAEICKSRAIKRSANDAAYGLDAETFETLYKLYEPPTVDEVFHIVITDK